MTGDFIRSKIFPYITERFGSVFAFKALKYLTEFTVARKNKGFAVYELTFEIPPSEVMTRKALAYIVEKADGIPRDKNIEAIGELIEKEFIKYDKKTDIVELDVDIKKFTNIHLKLRNGLLQEIKSKEKAEVIIFPLSIREKVCGLPDMIIFSSKNRKGELVEVKFSDLDDYLFS